MRKDLTDITMILDRSGSMESCRSDAEGGMNHFISEQKKHPGQAIFTLVQFDTEYEFVHRAVPIHDVPRCQLEPRGATALLDAVGRTIQETGQRLAAMAEADRPGLVVVAILTDGLENSSHQYTRARVREMIEHQQSVYRWQFIFLAADQDAFAEAGSLGIQGAVADFDRGRTIAAFGAMAGNVRRMRYCVQDSKETVNTFTPEERAAMRS